MERLLSHVYRSWLSTLQDRSPTKFGSHLWKSLSNLYEKFTILWIWTADLERHRLGGGLRSPSAR